MSGFFKVFQVFQVFQVMKVEGVSGGEGFLTWCVSDETSVGFTAKAKGRL